MRTASADTWATRTSAAVGVEIGGGEVKVGSGASNDTDVALGNENAIGAGVGADELSDDIEDVLQQH